MKFFLFMAALFLITSYSTAQNNSRIFGKVTDEKNHLPLLGVNILLYTDSLKTEAPVKGTASDKDGNYSLINLTKGVYWLFASSIGYEKISKKIILSGNSVSVEFDFKMNPKELQLDQILIEAKRDTFKNISVIDISPEFIKQLPSLSGEADVFKALTLLPGVTTSSEISSGLYIRGGSPDQTLTLVDGVVIYNPFHLGGFASTFNSDAINDLRLIKGAFPAEYGGRLGSVLDITLKNGSKENFKGKLGLGTISSHATVEGPISDKASYLISGRKMYFDILQKQFVKSKIIPLYNFFDVNGKFDYNFSEHDKISISGYTGDDNLYNSKDNKDAAYNIGWSNTIANLNWIHLTEEKKFTKAALNFTRYNFTTLITDKNPTAFKNDFYSSSTIQDFSLKIDGQYFGNNLHTVKNGIEVTLHNFDVVNNNFYTQALETDERVGAKFVSVETALYLQDQWQITPLLSSNLGLRFYYFPDARYFDIEPRASLTYAITSKIFLKGAFTISNQFLHLIVRNDVALPTDIWFPSTTLIKPSRGLQGVLGLEVELGDKDYVFSAEGYFKEMKNLYEYGDTATFTIESPIEKQLTNGRGDAYGFELFFNKQKGKFNGWIGYTLSWTRRYFDGINNGNSFYPRYDKRHDISIALTYKLNENWEFGAAWNYGTGQAYTMPTGQYYFPGVFSANNGPQIFLDYKGINEYRLPAYHKLDVSASYKMHWINFPIQITLSVYNLYNHQNPFARYVNFYNDGSNFIPQLKQFTLFPVFPALSLTMEI